MAGEAAERGHAARDAWVKSYAPASLFQTFGNAIESLASHENQKRNSKSPIQWNKWVASSGLMTRTAVQKLRGQR
jgi:hypothetical protein